MSIEQENLIPITGDYLPGQRFIMVGETLVPVGFGTPYIPGSTIVTPSDKGVYYKCASVDTANSKWTGYKATQLDDGTWAFAEEITTDLTFTEITPEKDSIYSYDALVKVKLWTGAVVITENATVTSITYGSYSCPIDPTGYTQGNYTISASSELGGQRSAYNAFYDHGTFDAEQSSWHSSSGTSNQWLQWQSTEKVLVTGYSMSFVQRWDCHPYEWKLQGSDDGSTWTDLDSISDYWDFEYTENGGGNTINRILSNTTPYYYHRIYVINATGSYVTIGLIRAGEVFEYVN